VGVVEGDDLGQGLDRRGGTERPQIGGQIGLELEEEDLQLAVVVLARVRGSAGSTRTAPRRTISARASSINRSTRGLKPKDFRTTPIRAPRRPSASRKRV